MAVVGFIVDAFVVIVSIVVVVDEVVDVVVVDVDGEFLYLDT